MKVPSLVDHVKKYLEQSIVRGELSPGEKIKEEDVSSRLGISRPPIREAFKLLEAEGLITRKARRGVFVSEVTEKDVWEIYTLKSAIYWLGTGFAIEHLSEKGLKKLENVVDMMGECVKQEPANVARYQKLNEDFHNIMIDMAGHQRVRKILSNLNNQIRRLSYQSMQSHIHIWSSYQYHKQILEAVKKKDMDLAQRLTREHVLKGLTVLQSMLEKSLQPNNDKKTRKVAAF